MVEILAEHFGSSSDERKASMTRQMPFDPLPASVWLNGFPALKRFAVVGIGVDLRGIGMRSNLA